MGAVETTPTCITDAENTPPVSHLIEDFGTVCEEDFQISAISEVNEG